MAKTGREEIVASAVEALHEPSYLAEQLVAQLRHRNFATELVQRAEALLADIKTAER